MGYALNVISVRTVYGVVSVFIRVCLSLTNLIPIHAALLRADLFGNRSPWRLNRMDH
jgi:hypothetical protein